MKKWLLLSLLCFFFSSATSAGERRDQLTVTCQPRLTRAGEPIQLRVKVTNVEKLYCPRLIVEWPDGTRSIRESDCDPLEDGEAAEDFRPEPIWFSVGEGEWSIRVRVEAGKSSKVGECRVQAF